MLSDIDKVMFECWRKMSLATNKMTIFEADHQDGSIDRD
ncbi:hypothetical protein VS85_02319 [Vibrio cholerae]|nr:hypothetical protein VS85_02319 [Vibrio cholerae]